MPEKNLVIAAVFAVILHCSVALVRTPAPQPQPLSEDKTLAVSIISEYKRSPEISAVAVFETKKEEDRKTDDRKVVAVKKRVEQRPAIPAEGRRKIVTPPKGATDQISERPPPLQAGQNTGQQTKKRVTVPPIPCYKSNPSPRYPELARRRGYEGEILLSAMISVDGTVIALKVKESSGHPILDRAAMKAVATWEFEPARRMGTPVTLLVDIPVRFVLRRP
ncbi:MAG: energy transducer TonB [Deltaproteobacteria bacterium]|nr:energy transducer TonB [Deltaproteobacteria bacterium]MBW2675259.1 energy transducer TonB [Deltaproteobacteria bacterium]